MIMILIMFGTTVTLGVVNGMSLSGNHSLSSMSKFQAWAPSVDYQFSVLVN